MVCIAGDLKMSYLCLKFSDGHVQPMYGHSYLKFPLIKNILDHWEQADIEYINGKLIINIDSEFPNGKLYFKNNFRLTFDEFIEKYLFFDYLMSEEFKDTLIRTVDVYFRSMNNFVLNDDELLDKIKYLFFIQDFEALNKAARFLNIINRDGSMKESTGDTHLDNYLMNNFSEI